jgi:hypothetical protein
MSSAPPAPPPSRASSIFSISLTHSAACTRCFLVRYSSACAFFLATAPSAARDARSDGPRRDAARRSVQRSSISATKAFVSGSTSAVMAGTEAPMGAEDEAVDSHGAAGAGKVVGESPGSHAVSHASFHSSSPVVAEGGCVRWLEDSRRRPEAEMGRRRARRSECIAGARRNAAGRANAVGKGHQVKCWMCACVVSSGLTFVL